MAEIPVIISNPSVPITTGYIRKGIYMRKFGSAFLASFIFFLLINASFAEQNDLIGKWAANVRTRGGLGGMWTFEPNGKASKSFGALVDFSYSVDGHTLKTVFKDSYTEKVEEDASPYEILGDTLITNPTDTTRRQEMKRVGSPRSGADPIVGIWTYKHYTGGMATMEFTSSGLAQLSVPFETGKFLYSLNGKEIIITSESIPSYRRKARLEKNTLIFPAEGDEEEKRYTRFAP
jgi:hypothetical protein